MRNVNQSAGVLSPCQGLGRGLNSFLRSAETLFPPPLGGGCPKGRRGVKNEMLNRVQHDGYSVRSTIKNLSPYSPIALSSSKKKFGFTLAEVLITLGIIGVVTALIMPALISKIQDKVLEVKREKAASTLINAWYQTAASAGSSLIDWNFQQNSGITEADVEADAAECKDESCFIDLELKMYFAMYVPDGLKIIRKSTAKSFKAGGSGMPSKYTLKTKSENIPANLNWDSGIWFVTEDGVWYLLQIYENEYSYANRWHFAYIVDVNGSKKPNAIGKDVFSIILSLDPDYNFTSLVDTSKIKDIDTCHYATSRDLSSRHGRYGGWFSEDEVEGGLCFGCRNCFDG